MHEENVMTCAACGTRAEAPERFDGLCPLCLFKTVVEPAPARSPLELLEGRELGNYCVLGLLGAGGMGAVYRARQKGLERSVALKVLSNTGAEDVERFFREARAAANLRHPNIVAVHEVAGDQGFYFIAMDLLDGGTLKGPLENRRAAEVLRTVARAVQHAHDHGVIHRDLKPSNIILDERGEPHVADFGLARQLGSDSGLTASGALMGTPSYMPPEQAEGDRERIDARSDVYALGAVLYECLTGRPPFVGENATDILRQVLRDEPVPPGRLNPRVDRDLETICLKALDKMREARYPTAGALGDDLDRYLNDKPIVARRRRALQRVARWIGRHPKLIAAAVVLAAAGAYVVPVLADRVRGHDELVRAVEEGHRRQEYLELKRREVEKARDLVHAGELDRAEAVLEAIEGWTPDAYVLAATIAQMRGQEDRGRELLLRAIALDREHPDAHYDLFHLVLWTELMRSESQFGIRNAENDAILDRCEEVLERQTLKPEQAHVVRAMQALRRTMMSGALFGDLEAGVAMQREVQGHLDAALAINPANVEALAIRCHSGFIVGMYLQGDERRAVMESALADAKKVVRLRAFDPENHYAVALLEGVLGNAEAARAAIAEALALGADNWTLQLQAGQAFYAVGDAAKAVEHLDRGLDLADDRETARIYRVLVHLGFLEGRFFSGEGARNALAMAETEALLKEFPDCVPGLIFRSLMRAMSGQYDLATQDLRRADELSPENPVVARFKELWGSRAPEYDF